MSDLLNLTRMARLLGVPRKWLQAEADAGMVPCLKAGNSYLFNADVVQETLAARAAQTWLRVDDGQQPKN